MAPKKVNSGLINFSSSKSRMRTIAPAPIQGPPKPKLAHHLISETFSSSSEASRVFYRDGGGEARESSPIFRQSKEQTYTPMMDGGGDTPTENTMTHKTETTETEIIETTRNAPNNTAAGLSEIDGDTSMPDDTPTVSPTTYPHASPKGTTLSDKFNIPDTNDNNDNNFSRPSDLLRRSSFSTCSTKSGRSSRRLIFSTLYEPTYQDPSLFRNQERQQTQVRNLPQSTPSHPSPAPPLPSVISLPPRTIDSAATTSSDDKVDKLLNSPSDLSTTNSKLDEKTTPLSNLNMNDLDISSFSTSGDVRRDGGSDAKAEKNTVSGIFKPGLKNDSGQKPVLTSILRNSKENLLDTGKKEKKSTDSAGCFAKFNLKSITKDFTRRSIIPKSSSDSCLDSFKAQIQMASTNSSSSELVADIPTSLPSSFLFNQTNKNRCLRRNDNRYDSSSTLSSNQTMTRHFSHEEIERKKTIRFDPRIWVHEIPTPPVEQLWYNQSDMNRFKCEAILRIRKWSVRKSRNMKKNNSQTMISTGTGRIVAIDTKKPSPNNNLACAIDRSQKVMYTNPALSCDDEEEDDDDEVAALAHRLSLRESGVVDEFRSILIVDSHDIYLTLLGKSFKRMLPHIQIATACNIEQASRAIEKANLMHKANKTEEYSHGFDIILIEERLKPHLQPKGGDQINWNGSSLIAKIKKETENKVFFRRDTRRHPLIIGISAFFVDDRQRIEASGADLVWGKPPPIMDNQLKISLLKKVMRKRNRSNIDQLF